MLTTQLYYSRLHYYALCCPWVITFKGCSMLCPSLNDPRWRCFQCLDLLLTVSMSSGTLPYLSVSVRYTPSPPFQSVASNMLSTWRSDELRGPRWVYSQVGGSLSEEGSGSFLMRAAQSFGAQASLPRGCAQPCFGLPPDSRVNSKLVKTLESRVQQT